RERARTDWYVRGKVVAGAGAVFVSIAQPSPHAARSRKPREVPARARPPAHEHSIERGMASSTAGGMARHLRNAPYVDAGRREDRAGALAPDQPLLERGAPG